MESIILEHNIMDGNVRLTAPPDILLAMVHHTHDALKPEDRLMRSIMDRIAPKLEEIITYDKQ